MRDIAAESGLSLGSVSYHFVDRVAVIADSLEEYVVETEQIVDAAISGGGVHDGLAVLFADRAHVLIRHELRLEAARDGTHHMRYIRCRDAAQRLVSAALRAHHQTAHGGDATAALSILDFAAIDTAIEYRDPEAFTAVMAVHLADVVAARTAS